MQKHPSSRNFRKTGGKSIMLQSGFNFSNRRKILPENMLAEEFQLFHVWNQTYRRENLNFEYKLQLHLLG